MSTARRLCQALECTISVSQHVFIVSVATSAQGSTRDTERSWEALAVGGNAFSSANKMNLTVFVSVP